MWERVRHRTVAKGRHRTPSAATSEQVRKSRCLPHQGGGEVWTQILLRPRLNIGHPRKQFAFPSAWVALDEALGIEDHRLPLREIIGRPRSEEQTSEIQSLMRNSN